MDTATFFLKSSWYFNLLTINSILGMIPPEKKIPEKCLFCISIYQKDMKISKSKWFDITKLTGIWQSIL